MPAHEHADVTAPTDTATAAPAREADRRLAAQFALALQRTAGNVATARALARVVRPDARTSTSGQDDTALSYQRHTGSVFVQGAGEDATGINADDVVQGALGDCYFLSPVMAVARINPQKIRRLIRGPVETWSDGTRIYDVDLYEGHAIGSPSKRTQRISDRFVTTASGGSRYAQPGDMGVSGGEIWVMLLEKAWAVMRGGFDRAHFGLMKDGLTAITGIDTDWTSIDGESDEDVFGEISACVRKGKPVTIQTKQEFTRENLLEARDIEVNPIAKHAYNIAGVGPHRKTIDIVNPHGENHLMSFPLVRLRRFFDYYVMSEESVR